METSVVISTYGRPDDLVECVDSLLGGFLTPDEIIVVDDGDVERTHQRLADAELLDEVKHLQGPQKNLPASRNAGVRATSGDIVCFVDDDVVVPATWLREVVETYERNAEVMGVGGYVLNFNPKNVNKADMDSFGYRALTGVRLAFLLDKIGIISPVGVLWAPHVFMTSEERGVETLQGCNMTFRREVFERHSFDEWYGSSGSAACEEIDFCGRLSAAGARLVYNPRAAVVHKRTVSDDSRTGAPNYDNITNLTYFVLNSPKLGLANYFLFVAAIVAYAAVTRDTGYLRGIVDGTTEALRSIGADDEGVIARD